MAEPFCMFQESTSMRLALIFAGLTGMSAVALGAITAHMGPDILTPQQQSWIETALKYQTWHALALLGVAALSAAYNSRLFKIAGYLFILGLLLFCGSLYILAATNLMAIGILTPFGGLSFILGWGCLTLAGFRVANLRFANQSP